MEVGCHPEGKVNRRQGYCSYRPQDPDQIRQDPMSKDRGWKEYRRLRLNKKHKGWNERFEKTKILQKISGTDLYHKMEDAEAENDLRRPEHSGK